MEISESVQPSELRASFGVETIARACRDIGVAGQIGEFETGAILVTEVKGQSRIYRIIGTPEQVRGARDSRGLKKLNIRPKKFVVAKRH